MFGKNPPVNPHTLLKQLLIAESEINRVQLTQQWRRVVDETRCLAHQAWKVATLGQAAASLISVLDTFRNKKDTPDTTQFPWWNTFLKGIGWVSTFWSEFLSHSSAR